MAKKKKAKTAEAQPELPTWPEVAGMIRAEVETRGMTLTDFHRMLPAMKWTTLHTALKKAENSQWSTITMLIRALGWTLADIEKRFVTRSALAIQYAEPRIKAA